MEKCLIWYKLSLKQNIRKFGTWILLFSMLFLLWITANIHMPDKTNTTVAICYNGSIYEEEVKEAIENGNSQFDFDIYDDADDISEAVAKGDVECGFMFADDFDDKVAEGDWEDAVLFYSTPFGTKTDVAKETLYVAVYPIYSRWLLVETEDEIYTFDNPDRINDILAKHDEYLEGTFFLSFEEVTVETKNSDKESVLSLYEENDSIYMIQGLVELFVLLSMLLAAGVYGEKETAQIESALLVREKTQFRYINILANGTLIATAGFLAIVVSTESRGLIVELALMLVLLLVGSLGVLIFSKCFKNRLTYMSWVVTFVICFLLLRFGVAGYITH